MAWGRRARGIGDKGLPRSFGVIRETGTEQGTRGVAEKWGAGERTGVGRVTHTRKTLCHNCFSRFHAIENKQFENVNESGEVPKVEE